VVDAPGSDGISIPGVASVVLDWAILKFVASFGITRSRDSVKLRKVRAFESSFRRLYSVVASSRRHIVDMIKALRIRIGRKTCFAGETGYEGNTVMRSR
jgi:hypothetical protein